MPWMEQRTMSLKMEFVERAIRPGVRMSKLCREFGITRQTGYKWLSRYKREGPDGLEERSRRPKSSPLATEEELVLAVLELRDAYPRRGPKKLLLQLQRRLGSQTPSVSTIARILRRFGKVRQRGRFRRLSIVECAPTVRAEACNDVWTVDFKGWWRVRDGQRCEPLTVRDAFSRYVLAIKVLKSPSLEEVKAVFEQLFRRYGVPRYIQCDNGCPFINVQARGGLTRLSAWWVCLGIKVLRSRRGCPQDNGAHERMHRDMSDDLQSFPAGSLGAEQRACDRWRQEFNHVRPHEALKGKTPAELYKPSERRPRVTSYLYPTGWIVRTVTDGGVVNVRGAQVQAGKALVRQRLALEPLEGLKHRLWFRDLDLGTVELPMPTTIIDEVSQQYLARTGRRHRRAATALTSTRRRNGQEASGRRAASTDVAQPARRKTRLRGNPDHAPLGSSPAIAPSKRSKEVTQHDRQQRPRATT
jgi:putative transposase